MIAKLVAAGQTTERLREEELLAGRDNGLLKFINAKANDHTGNNRKRRRNAAKQHILPVFEAGNFTFYQVQPLVAHRGGMGICVTASILWCCQVRLQFPMNLLCHATPFQPTAGIRARISFRE
jgi:hypothetical protein